MYTSACNRIHYWHDVSKSVNIIQDVIEKSSIAIESGYLSIKHVVFDHQFATRRILWDEISMQGRKLGQSLIIGTVNRAIASNMSKSQLFSRQLDSYSLDPDNANVHVPINCQQLHVIPRSRYKSDVDDAANRENAKFQGVYQIEDYHFLMSLYRQLNEVLLMKKMKVKAKTRTISYEELRTRICDPHNCVRTILRYAVSGSGKEKVC